MCQNRANINKDTNTKHPGTNSVSKIFNYKCLICEDTFETKNELQMHVKNQIEEIEVLDITSIKKYPKLF